jgi:hypothetical protein
VRELRPGLWHWEAPHPEWSGPENEALRQRLAATAETPSQAGVVSSYAIDNGDQLLLFDPLAAPREIVELAADRETAIVLTCRGTSATPATWRSGSARRCSCPRPTRAAPMWPGRGSEIAGSLQMLADTAQVRVERLEIAQCQFIGPLDPRQSTGEIVSSTNFPRPQFRQPLLSA